MCNLLPPHLDLSLLTYCSTCRILLSIEWVFATVLPGSSFRESLQHEYNLVEKGMELTLVKRRRGWERV